MKAVIFVFALFQLAVPAFGLSLMDSLRSQIEERWPLPMSDRCLPGDSTFWKQEAATLSDTSTLEKFQSAPDLRILEEGILKNALITRAYHRLFLSHMENTSTPYAFWLGSAAFGSRSIGQELRAAYRRLADLDLHLGNSGLAELLEWENRPHGLASLAFGFRDFSYYLASANQAIFNDIFWGFLAGESCGPLAVAGMMEHEGQANAERPMVMAHYKRMASAWERISETDPDTVMQANLDLLWDEQAYVLQPLMYDPWQARVASFARVFNRYAYSALPGPRGKLKTFEQYCKDQGLSPNLSDLNIRMKWLSYLVTNHREYFLLQNDLSSPFGPIETETRMVLGDYL